MRTTILFGGLNRERLVSVASTQAVSAALPDADLWFWDLGDTVHETRFDVLQKHERPFEVAFKPGTPSFGGIARALDRAQAENRVLVFGMHGGMAENGELQVMCDMRGIPYVGSGSASSYLAFDKNNAKRFAAIAGLKTATSVLLEDIEAAFDAHGRLVAKPARDGSSYGLMFVNAKQDLVAVRRAAATEEYLIEVHVSGVEGTCAVIERLDGSIVALPPIEIIPPDGGAFDYEAKYIAKATQEICPGRFSAEVTAQLMDGAVKAHKALSCRGYSRSDFIITDKGPVFLETNTLPGLTRSSLLPKALKAQGIEFVDFLRDQIALAERLVKP
jgi:D-alanine-D-alanine ligase